VLDVLRRWLRRVLKISDAPPEAPSGEQPEVFRASEKYLTYLLVQWAIKCGILFFSTGPGVIAGAVAVVVENKHTWIAPVLLIPFGVLFALFALLSYVAIRIDYDYRWYVLTDRSLRIREGVWSMREVTLTLANVQDIKVSQGPIQRLLSIHDVIVDTAGGSGATEKASVQGHRGILRGVEVGSALVEKIRARVKQQRGTGLGDHDEHVEVDPFLDALRGLREEARKLRESVT
jgi:uncharacterized membrane protein YdbT with pleckstrin-like domain